MKLQEGNVIELKQGMKVYAFIPEKFVYSNSQLSNELARTEIEIGRTYENNIDLQHTVNDITKCIIERFSWRGVVVDKQKVVDFIIANIEPPRKEQFIIAAGEFVVIKTSLQGGGRAHNDTYSDGYHVVCKALKNGGYDEDGVEVNFYQSGSFTCVISDIKPIRNMKPKYV